MASFLCHKTMQLLHACEYRTVNHRWLTMWHAQVLQWRSHSSNTVSCLSIAQTGEVNFPGSYFTRSSAQSTTDFWLLGFWVYTIARETIALTYVIPIITGCCAGPVTTTCKECPWWHSPPRRTPSFPASRQSAPPYGRQGSVTGCAW